MPNWRSPPIFLFCAAPPIPKNWSLAASNLGFAGIGIADRNSVAGVVRASRRSGRLRRRRGTTEMQPRKSSGTIDPILIKLAVGARLVFSDGTPDILAYPRDRAAWGRLTRLLSLGKRRAEKGDCILGLPDLLEFIEGLNLIVMPPLRDSCRHGCMRFWSG